MITEKLYYSDSHLREFSAKVISCEADERGYKILLDRTAFFPEGGGQASDRGYINNSFVFDVQIENGEIIHYAESPLNVNEEVYCKLDFERRFSFMQNHSGEHIISGLVNKLYGFDNVGFHLSDESCTLDFNGILSRSDLDRIEMYANEKIWQNVKFRCYYPDNDALKNLKYRAKKEIDGEVRIVEIENTDICACCAPHVSEASEIGIIKLLDFENLRGGVRINFKCGREALLDYRNKYENVYGISGILSAKQYEVFSAVNKLLEKVEKDKQIIKQQKEKIAEIIVNNADKNETLYFLDGFEIKELQQLADLLHKTLGGLRCVFSKKDDGYQFAMCDNAEVLDNFFADFKRSFNVKGGGRNGLFQGTVFATEENLRNFFQFE